VILRGRITEKVDGCTTQRLGESRGVLLSATVEGRWCPRWQRWALRSSGNSRCTGRPTIVRPWRNYRWDTSPPPGATASQRS